MIDIITIFIRRNDPFIAIQFQADERRFSTRWPWGSRGSVLASRESPGCRVRALDERFPVGTLHGARAWRGCVPRRLTPRVGRAAQDGQREGGWGGRQRAIAVRGPTARGVGWREIARSAGVVLVLG